jgi:uncharacterized membrane protein
MTAPEMTTEEARLERGEILLSKLLRLGVVASAIIIIVGAMLFVTTQQRTGYLGHGLDGLIAYPARPGAAPIDNSIGEVLKGLQVGEPDAVIVLGLLMLIATPILRVATSVIFFLLQRDYRYVLITLFVLIVLLTALMSGAAE